MGGGSLMKTFAMLFIVSLIFQFSTALAYRLPDPKLTPGAICTEHDPDFKGYDYPSQVARCNRNVSFQEKKLVAENYGNIDVSQWKNYEFDHYMPLCAGGSNSLENLWPQPLSEAAVKDKLEVEICNALKTGSMTQPQALQKVHDWFNNLSKQKESFYFDEILWNFN